jgi:ubiquinone/menaquinone biosynthesis C-methylase UbiE
MTGKPPGFFEGTEMPDGGWWEALWPDPAQVLAIAGLEPGMTVVDLCAGDGWFTLPLARVARRVIAVDIDAKLLNLARLRLDQSALTNCEFQQADAYELVKVVPEPADFVFLANAFHGVPEPTRLSLAVASVLSPGGRFAIVNWHARPREDTTISGQPRGPKTELRMAPEAAIAAVEPSGLKFVRLAQIPPYHYAALFEKVLV